MLSWAWELDPACQQVVKSRHPEVVQKGDALTTDPAGVVEALRTQCQKDTFVLVTCAPPCPDFSQIKGSLSLGTAGPEGRKFVDWIHKWWKPFSSSCKFELGFLVENVTMSQQVQTSLDNLLQTRSFMSDAASFGLVSRPRLWWASHIKPPENLQLAPQPIAAGMARWRKWNRNWELLPSSSRFPRQVAATCRVGRFSGSVRFPCLTTPAPTQEGRPPPPKRKREESPETMARWRQDSQQFAPWHYRAYALVEPHGKVGPPTAEVREFLHDFPVGYTAGSPERERCKQLGNSWHLPTSRFILFVLLFSAQVLQVSSSSQPQWYTPLPSPTFEVRYHPEGSRPLLRACSWWRRAQLTWDPNEYTHGPLVGPDTCPRQHFAWATAVRWEDAFPAKLNPCLQWAYDQQQTFGPKLVQWRQAVVEDITGFVQECAEDQEAWLATSPQHVRKVYKQGTPGYVFQLLAFSHLLKLLDFSEWDALVHDLFWGFPLLGHVPPGSGWLLRSDAKYSNPWTKEQFEAFNTEHVRQIVSKPRNDEHAETMLQEVLKEATKARFVGPYSLQWLQAQSERHNVYAARAFAIIQDDKIRRGDDWLRSAHRTPLSGGSHHSSQRSDRSQVR